METLTITQPDDWHLHLREGDKLKRTVSDSAKQFARAIIMPNLLPPVTTVLQAEQYYRNIIEHIPTGSDFQPLMTLYLTEQTTVETIKAVSKHDNIVALKLYPAGATTNSEAGVNNIATIYPVLEAMQKYAVPLLLHGEVTHGDIFDREQLFIENILSKIYKDFPELKIVLEHITTQEAADFVTEASGTLSATITPQHLLFNRNNLLAGGVKPDYYCLPVLKREKHQKAIVKAAISGNPKFFLGTDSAPHNTNAKYSACGCAGIYSAHSALELYASVFEAENALDKLEGFASFYGADFYGLARNQTTITLKKQTWIVPEQLSFADELITPLWASETLEWQVI